ncbi:rotamase-domain-containing protein [Clavulina sp. PMI_390]|nr:rotamase-domain-containing protein [Clavulina sp. PMI_390]
MPDWVVKLSNSRQVPYFLNSETKESKWDAPEGLSLAQIMALPGATDYLNADGTPKPPPGKAGEVRASHLLVKHSGSRRPSSWKEANITRSKADAITILKGYQDQIVNSPNPRGTFDELAAKHSDCGSHAQSGDLGWFGRGQMQKPFEEAAYALENGKMSDVVETDSGVHLILRTG